MNLTGTHIAYLHTCHRKLWLFANGIQMGHIAGIEAKGKLISKTNYTNRVCILEILQKCTPKRFFKTTFFTYYCCA
ncbi:Dna2/Cas4 domain-containing protein [Anditalea andensis]|uniref:Dna2/Cas4 domain-containing protein n=1 Tax=Anditalea andensis TaxID=1048983 RepID=UPI0009FFA871|nr:Dna2/Cas4 domain-containing protein [Anditalea andensis]